MVISLDKYDLSSQTPQEEKMNEMKRSYIFKIDALYVNPKIFLMRNFYIWLNLFIASGIVKPHPPQLVRKHEIFMEILIENHLNKGVKVFIKN